MKTRQQVLEPTSAQVEQALEWYWFFAEQSHVDSSDEKFTHWLQTDRRHFIAWERVVALQEKWSQSTHKNMLPVIEAVVQLQKETDVFQAAKPYVLHKLKARKGLLASLLAMCTALGLSQSDLGQWWLADYHAMWGENKTIALADGSTVVLSSGSAINVEYTEAERKVVLLKGKLFVDVAKNPSRPFLIESTYGRATALGTRYGVDVDDEKMQVAVIESTVKVCVAKSNQACQTLTQNQQVLVMKGAIGAISTIEPEAYSAWMKQKIIANNRLLVDVLQEMNRHYAGVIHFDAKKMAGIRVSGVFMLNRPQETLDLLQATAPISYQIYANKVIVVANKSK